MKRPSQKAIALLLATGFVLGCAPKNIRVRCEQHLQPINPPTLAEKAAKVPAAAVSAELKPAGATP